MKRLVATLFLAGLLTAGLSYANAPGDTGPGGASVHPSGAIVWLLTLLPLLSL